jgi:hypothetical protein
LGQVLTRLEQIDLPQNGKWEQEIGFTPQIIGNNQKVEFLLYKNGLAQPQNTLILLLDVKGE